jgi:hypothetical protein
VGLRAVGCPGCGTAATSPKDARTSEDSNAPRCRPPGPVFLQHLRPPRRSVPDSRPVAGRCSAGRIRPGGCRTIARSQRLHARPRRAAAWPRGGARQLHL